MINKNIKHIVLVFLLVSQFNSEAQRYFAGRMEFGVLVGGSNYHGDLAKEIVLSETHLMLGAYFERNYNEWFSIRYQMSYGKISGTDKNFPIYSNRNLSFFSNIIEGAAIAEFNFLPFGLNPNMSYFSPYVFGGLAVFHFEPKAKFGDEIVSLRKLGTEGQGMDGKKRYSPIQMSVPMGFGLKIKQSQNLVVGIEVGFRKTWTDYLDDVSGEYPDYEKMLAEKGLLAASMSHRYKEEGIDYTTDPGNMRGDPHLNDWYFFMNLRIGFKFGRPICANEKSF